MRGKAALRSLALLVVLPWVAISQVQAEGAGSASERLAEAVNASIQRSPELSGLLAELEADAANAAGAVAAGLPWIEAEAQDRRWPGGGPTDGAVSMRLGVPFRYPWQWSQGGALSRQARTWHEVARRAVLLEHSRELVTAWIEWAATQARMGVTARWLERADTLLALEQMRLDEGALPQIEAAWLQVERARTASRHHEADVDRAQCASDVVRLAGGSVAPVQDEDLTALVAATITPAADFETLRMRMRDSALFLAAVAQSDRDRLEGEARAAAARGNPRLELGLRQDTEADFEWDLMGEIAVRVPLPFGQKASQGRAKAMALARAGERARAAAEADFDLQLEAAMEKARAAQRWVESQSAAADALAGAESTLASQYDLGDISGSDYLNDLERLERVRLQSIDAARSLLLARLDVALLVEDATLFPPALPAD